MPLFSAPAWAQPLGGDEDIITLADADPLTDEEMQDLRGGFVDPTGLIYRFAVNVETALNGSPVFTRSLTVSPSGKSGALQASSSANLLPQNIPPNLAVAMIGNGEGIQVSDENGTTTIMNQNAAGVPSSIILNPSSNRAISQTVGMALTLRNTNMSTFATAARNAAQSARTATRTLGF